MIALLAIVSSASAAPWKRHTIDNASRGADGVRLADVNGDGLLDIATPWEEGGMIRICLNPGPTRVKQPWPAVTIGQVKSPEDAVLVDLDGDGAMDVVSSCEGNTQAMFVHWAPSDVAQNGTASSWCTEAIPCTVGATRWMLASPAQVDRRHGVDLFVGSKSPGGLVGWLQSPPDARDLKSWRLHRLYQAGWIMSLVPIDMDRDGDCDVLASDRYGDRAGLLWLEHPGTDAPRRPWTEHRLGLDGLQVMFIDTCDVNGDGCVDVAAAVKPRKVSLLLQPRINVARTVRTPRVPLGGGQDKGLENASATGASIPHGPTNPWAEHVIEFPEEGFGTSKAVRVVDVDQDGRLDLVVTCEGANGPRSGVFWMSHNGDSLLTTDWAIHDISGPEGTKYDLAQLLDLDDDGDLDVLTCEERVNLGVIWYENPVR